MLQMDENSKGLDKVFESVPDAISKVVDLFKKNKENKE